MIVLDACATADLLLRLNPDPIRASLADQEVHAPQLMDLEVAQAIRRVLAAGQIDSARAAEAMHDLAAFPVEYHRHRPLLARVWELRNRLTCYDAAYLALAELLGCRLVTRDRGLAAVAATTVEVMVP